MRNVFSFDGAELREGADLAVFRQLAAADPSLVLSESSPPEIENGRIVAARVRWTLDQMIFEAPIGGEEKILFTPKAAPRGRNIFAKVRGGMPLWKAFANSEGTLAAVIAQLEGSDQHIELHAVGPSPGDDRLVFFISQEGQLSSLLERDYSAFMHVLQLPDIPQIVGWSPAYSLTFDTRVTRSFHNARTGISLVPGVFHPFISLGRLGHRIFPSYVPVSLAEESNGVGTVGSLAYHFLAPLHRPPMRVLRGKPQKTESSSWYALLLTIPPGCTFSFERPPDGFVTVDRQKYPASIPSDLAGEECLMFCRFSAVWPVRINDRAFNLRANNRLPQLCGG